jgi:signal transduction histidine kinase
MGYLPAILLPFVYFLAAKYGLSLAFTHVAATTVWPPTGIALAAVLLMGNIALPGIALGALAINYWISGNWLQAAGISLGNTAEAWVGAYLVHRFAAGRDYFGRTREAVLFVAACLLSPIVSATVGTSVLWLLHSLDSARSLYVWGIWWIGDAVGGLIFAPLLLAWLGTSRERWKPAQIAEYVVLLVLMCVVAQIIFNGWNVFVAVDLPLGFLCLPFMVWAAFRFGLRGVTSAVVVLALPAMHGTLRHLGPFVRSGPDESLLLLTTYLGTASMLGLALTGVITEREKMAQKLEESNRDLERFAYAASHDLQEPLRQITSYMNLLEKKYSGKLDEEAHHFIGFAVTAAKRMRELIHSLLQLSRVSAEVAEEAVDCTALMGEIISNLNLAIAESKAKIEVSPLPTIVASRPGLLQLFQNLVANAIKFRASELPLVEVAASRRDGECIFTCKDNGIGMAQEQTERIFFPFQRLHSQSEYSGSGIGLATCKRIVGNLGGRIWVESRPGKGSTFFFSVPLWRVNGLKP